jgi:hypothetical protein
VVVVGRRGAVEEEVETGEGMYRASPMIRGLLHPYLLRPALPVAVPYRAPLDILACDPVHPPPDRFPVRVPVCSSDHRHVLEKYERQVVLPHGGSPTRVLFEVRDLMMGYRCRILRNGISDARKGK